MLAQTITSTEKTEYDILNFVRGKRMLPKLKLIYKRG